MRDFTKINTAIWQSKKFEKLSHFDRLVYLYLLTNQHVNSVGCYQLKMGYAMVDLNCGDKAYLKAIDSLSELVSYNENENIIFIHDFVKQSPPTNHKHARGMVSIWEKLPECLEKHQCSQQFAGLKYMEDFEPDDAYTKPIDSLCKAYRYTETETETETETDKKNITKKFDDFWSAYGKRVDKKQALDQWQRKVKTEELANQIIEAAKAYSASREPTYRKSPMRWLRDENWNDEQSASEAASQPFDGSIDAWKRKLGDPASKSAREVARNYWNVLQHGPNPFLAANSTLPDEIVQIYGEAWGWKA